MKKIKFSLIILSLIPLILFSSCDELDNPIPLNVPVDYTVTAEGSNSPIQEKDDFCLTEFDAYNDIIDQIESISYLTASYETLENGAVPTDIQGDITINLKTPAPSNIQLVSYTLTNVKAADYIKNPVELVLSQNDIQLLNNFLSNLSNTCLVGELIISNISGQPAYKVVGKVTIVLKAMVTPG